MNPAEEIAGQEGFAGCWLLAPGFFSYYAKRKTEGELHHLGRRLSVDVRADYPWADRIALLIYPYRPYPASACISGYYVASNTAYHAAGRVISCLGERGIRAERADVPIRELCLRAGIATALKNGLLSFGEFGSRVVCQTLAIRIGLPAAETEWKEDADGDGPMFDPRCRKCSACGRACPSKAIKTDGFRFRNCLRGKLEGDIIPDEVKSGLPFLFGCERCQYVCPVNRLIPETKEIPEELTVDAILRDGGKRALALIGKNQNKGGRVTAHACILAARTGRSDLLPLIEPLRTDRRPMVSDAAEWASRRLRNTPEMQSASPQRE